MQAVTFDLWQTLMHDGKETGLKRGELRIQRIHSALSQGGVERSREEVAEVCRGIWSTWQAKYWDKDVDPGFDAQIEFLRERLGVAPGADEIMRGVQAGYVEPIFDLPPHADPEAAPALSELAASGMKIGLICNTSVTPGFALRRLLGAWGLAQYLIVQLFSDEIGLRKPAAEVFRQAAEELGVEIGALLHIGDRADVDVQAAIDAGARGLLVGPDTSLRKLVATITSSPA